MGIYDQLSRIDESEAGTAQSRSTLKTNQQRASRTPASQSPGQSTGRPTTQSADRPVPKSQDVSKDRLAGTSPILPRPKSFYITERQDELIDDVVKAVRKHKRTQALLRIRRLAAPDRSTVVRLIFEDIDCASKEVVNRLVERLVG